MLTASRFKDLWERIGATGPWKAAWEKIFTAYLEPHRAYHNLDHVEDFLDELGAYAQAHDLPQPQEAQMVGVGHDLVHVGFRLRTLATDDEEQSAKSFSAILREGGVDESKILRISEGILGSKHGSGRGVAPDMWAAMDADMAILGKPRVRYNRYRKDIEDEYRYDGTLPEIAYVKGRLEFLNSMIARPHLYRTTYFHNRYDVRARANMAYEKAILMGRQQLLTP